MDNLISATLFVLSGVGVTLLLMQALSLARHLGAPRPEPRRPAGISILKPLCGFDDQLAANLEAFAAMPYERCELLLGVRDELDTAWPVARAAAARWPERVRVVVQRGAPGLNPKVNQLITLAGEAAHELLVISDSNVRPRRGYLDELAAHMEDLAVGLVTNPVSSAGERTLGSLCDGLHVSTAIGPGMVAAKRVTGQDLVVGKSIAIRAGDLALVGGFRALKDVLAEDYLLGKLVTERLGKRVVMAATPITQVSERATLAQFLGRFFRWSVIHRKVTSTPVYAAELLLNPIVLALVALAAHPSLAAAAAVSALSAGKVAADVWSAHHLRARDERLGWWAFLLVPVKDVLLAGVWAWALVKSCVVWRGNRIEVGPGSRILPADTAGPARRRARARA